MSIAEQFIEMNGIIFKIERNDSVIAELKGRQETEMQTKKRYVGFFVGSDVKPGDWIVNPSGERLYIVDTLTVTGLEGPSELRAYFQTSTECNSKPESQSTVFNIGTANNSVIGNQSHFTMNIATSLQEARSQIDSSGSNDKEELHKIIDLLESVANNKVPIKKGMLSRFSELMERNSWITSSMSSLALNLLMSQIH